MMRTKRSGSSVREQAIIEAISRGLVDMEAGRVVPHRKAMHRLKATIARAGSYGRKLVTA